MLIMPAMGGLIGEAFHAFREYRQKTGKSPKYFGILRELRDMEFIEYGCELGMEFATIYRSAVSDIDRIILVAGLRMNIDNRTNMNSGRLLVRQGIDDVLDANNIDITSYGEIYART